MTFIHGLQKKQGIYERHIAADGECSSDMAVSAAEKLFSEYGIDRSNIDFILLCTQSPDYFLPTTACLLQHRLGISRNCGLLISIWDARVLFMDCLWQKD